MEIGSELHKTMALSFLRTGLVLVALAIGLLIYKNTNGYTKVEKIATYNNCKIKIWWEDNPFGNKRSYYLSALSKGNESIEIDVDRLNNDEEYDVYNDSIVVNDIDEVLYQKAISLSYSRNFINYKDDRLTVYKTAAGKDFPVYKTDCDAVEAEREYRKLDPPIKWYWVYGLVGGAGFLCLIYATMLGKTAANYANDDYRFVPDRGYEDYETAMAMLYSKRADFVEKQFRDHDRKQRLEIMIGSNGTSPKSQYRRMNTWSNVERENIRSKYKDW